MFARLRSTNLWIPMWRGLRSKLRRSIDHVKNMFLFLIKHKIRTIPVTLRTY